MKLRRWTFDNWLFGGTVTLWHSWCTFRNPLTWTDFAWHSCFITISAKHQFRYFTGSQQTWPHAWSTHYATPHTNCEMLTKNNNKLSIRHCGSKLSPKSKKWNAMSGALNGALQMKRMADKSLLIAACHHIINLTLMLYIYTLQTKPLVIHKQMEHSIKNKLYTIATTSLLAVDTNSLK
jgi:hypothetical protein